MEARDEIRQGSTDSTVLRGLLLCPHTDTTSATSALATREIKYTTRLVVLRKIYYFYAGKSLHRLFSCQLCITWDLPCGLSLYVSMFRVESAPRELQ